METGGAWWSRWILPDVFLKCSDNNRASTVFQDFIEAVRWYGLPSRVRCDQGGENVDVSLFMLTHELVQGVDQ